MKGLLQYCTDSISFEIHGGDIYLRHYKLTLTTSLYVQEEQLFKDASFKVEPAKSGRKLDYESGMKFHGARESRNKKDSETFSGPEFFLETQERQKVVKTAFE